MERKYKIVDISTVKGIKKAERLKAKGYIFSIIGIDKLIFTIPGITISFKVK